jgi:hypothetical protein
MGVIFGAAVGLGVAALAIDTGLMYSAKSELQSAADAAALAAASRMGETEDPMTLAAQEAAAYAAKNKIAGLYADLNVVADVVFGNAVLNGDKFDFLPEQLPYDAVRITLHRDATAADGPVSLLFAKALGMAGKNLQASATAMLVPRDIAVVIDFSGSMNDDSELRHYKQFPSESGGTRPGVQINLKECWQALGSPWPTWGQMTAFGSDIVLGSYNPTSDAGLWRIPMSSSCSESAVTTQLTSRSYSSAERSALMSGSGDTATRYGNRTSVILGLADWKSGKLGGKFGTTGGNGDNYVDSSELTNKINFPYPTGTSYSEWNNYINYVKSNTTQMYGTDSNFRYRYGIKTLVNYLLETRYTHSDTPGLAGTPEQPLQSVKDAVRAMIEVIVNLETQDHASLEAFAQYGYHLHDLTVPDSPDEVADALREIADTLDDYQAGHFTSVTNIGAGFQKAVEELGSARARASAAKIVILLTDGKPNVNQSNTYVGDNDPAAISWAEAGSAQLVEMGATVYVIGVGGDVNSALCESLASTPENYFFADSTPDPDNGGQPVYVTRLQQIFETLGGKRPVRLIQ